MRITSPLRSPKSLLLRSPAPLLLAILSVLAAPVRAQRSIPAAARELALPDAPDAAVSSSSHTEDPASPDPALPQRTPPPGQPGSPLPRHVSATELVIAAGQIAPHQTSGDKILSALQTSVSPFSFTGEVIAASYSQAVDSAPNYGQNGTGYAQRLGAAVARGTSQSIFTTAVMASVLHEDPRYYQLGRGHAIVNRGVYAVTRPFIGRTDGGRQTPNIALLTGYLGAAALTPTYYPPRNQGVGQVFATYATSLGGAALGGLVHEFLPEVLQAVHLR